MPMTDLPTRSEAVKIFLTKYAHSDMSSRYHLGMECQVNVAADGGTPTEGTYMGRNWNGYKDEAGVVWKPFRIPYKANTEPEYNDIPMSFPLADHVESIGMTGWNWQEQKSEWWGFDFDSIKGHSEAHTRKLTDEQLREVQQTVEAVPWVTVRRSTSGKGLHLYVHCLGYPTANHLEHAAAGRAILSYMSAIVSYDFHAKADACGGNMWVWHRKMVGTDGLVLLKQGELLPIEKIPANWRDHLKVVSGRTKRVIPSFIDDIKPLFADAEKIFEEITGQRLNVPLDDEHKALIRYFEENNCQWWWDSDRHMLVTHTYHLKEAHETLQLRGIFQTISTGTERGVDHNCYAFPIRQGGWVVRRYSPGTAEAPTWDQDQSGYTRCFYNRKPDLKVAARACEGVEQLNGSFVFASAGMAQKAALMLGADLKVPTQMLDRPVELRQKDDKLGVDLKAVAQADSASVMTGWALKAGNWKKVVQIQTPPTDSGGMMNYDDQVRHIISASHDDAGWVIRSDNEWTTEPIKHVHLALKTNGYSSKDAEMIEGTAVSRPWKIVNLPFQPEYPGDRQWNKNAAQFRIVPAKEIDPNGCKYWSRILNHLGKGLDESIEENGWCRINGIKSGSDYLKTWIASMIQKPLEPLPYLFFYSPEENTGKSTFHEAIRLLVSKGIEFADNALTNPTGFNGELVNSVLCVVEETSLQGNKIAHARIRAWVTNKHFPVHIKKGTPYSIPNSTHWVQFANHADACPIFSGDTRITMLTIQPLEPSELIPKRILFERLEKEAPYFLAELLRMEIPPSNDRLNVPIINTREKIALQTVNETLLQTFLREAVHHVPGEVVSVDDMWKAFFRWLDEDDKDKWSKIKMGKDMPAKYPKGRWNGPNWYYGNCSLKARKTGDLGKPLLFLKGEKLVELTTKVAGA